MNNEEIGVKTAAASTEEPSVADNPTPSVETAAVNADKTPKSKKRRGSLNVFLITFVIAAACVAAVFAVAYFLGFHYERITAADGSTVKFYGQVDKAGIPKKGTLYFSSGVKATIQADSKKVTYSDGSVYEGTLGENLLMEGEGTYTYANGNVYTGNFSGGLFNGAGKISYKNGDRYEGDFKNGAKDGKGTYTMADGSYYTGDFVQNRREGYGEYYWADGTIYKGAYADDLKNGEGVFYFSNGDIYQGDFVNDAREGKGTYTWKECGDQYVGEFKNNTIEGYGTYTYANGSTYEGYFENGTKVKEDEATQSTAEN